ncbi:hypothetical protein OH492_11775 [Vibrio chagasii]|nr:hypothetical protein [Vibrio chagasii]
MVYAITNLPEGKQQLAVKNMISGENLGDGFGFHLSKTISTKE